jgi:hypothetical protein
LENNFPVNAGKGVKQSVKHFPFFLPNCFIKTNNSIVKPAIDHIRGLTIEFNLLNKTIRKNIKYSDWGLGIRD